MVSFVSSCLHTHTFIFHFWHFPNQRWRFWGFSFEGKKALWFCVFLCIYAPPVQTYFSFSLLIFFSFFSFPRNSVPASAAGVRRTFSLFLPRSPTSLYFSDGAWRKGWLGVDECKYSGVAVHEGEVSINSTALDMRGDISFSLRH